MSNPPDWRRLVDHVASIPERVYEHWVPGTGWDNITQFGAEYGWNGVPWCAIFEWCMFHDVGLDAIVPKTAAVAELASWAQAHGQWSEYPSVGSLTIFGGDVHTEIVTGFDADNVYTKGGNSIQAGATDDGQGNGVWSHQHARRDPYVTGYLAPRFPDGVCPPTADPVDPRGGRAVGAWRWIPLPAPGPAPVPSPQPAPGYAEETVLAYLPPIPADADTDVPVEPAGTDAAPGGGARNGPMWLCVTPQGADGSVAVSMRTDGTWGAPVEHAVAVATGKLVLPLPTDGSVDVVRLRSTVPLQGYVTGRQVG
ncbi:hypothetical protein [Streptacidiphilus neutrinimicus]|uniref:hypothetical protein n=1 Tax=Streptacidiphilus neutrinimicus TaxID=105420 RepID=UPI0006938E5B|nr:hypothetical protein [Streptacidiphilus neutrinimicus]